MSDDPIPRLEAAKEYVRSLRAVNRIDEKTMRELLSVMGEYDEGDDDEM